MKISYNWLQDYINLKNTPPQKVAHTLTMGIVEVEDIIKQGKGLDDKIITGEIINIKKHPNADKLQVVEVNVGKKNLSIVCGAENTKTGQIVPVAQVGAKIYNPQEDKLIKLKKADIRGVKSEGMLLAEDELKLGKDHEGILILDPRVEVGIPLKKALGLDDVVIDIDNKSLTHRADLYCHIGIAREIAALLGKKLKTPKIPKVKEKDKKKLSIEIKDFNLCPRYTGVVLDNIKVKESPLWIQKRLKAVGLQTINSVVDITNYVMLEYGQPMHAFDAEKIISQKIIVRKAKDKEKITTLDGVKRILDKSMLVISDPKKAIAIAGVMGGKNSEVSQNTKKIILESANFYGINIRKTSTKLGLKTDAVTRFEKNIDSNLTITTTNRAVELLEKYANAKVASKICDVYKSLPKPKKITLTKQKLENYLGVKIPDRKVVSIFSSLELQAKQKRDKFEVEIPTFRRDLNLEVDLVEEVARIYGYDKFPTELPESTTAPPDYNPLLKISYKIKKILTIKGFTEVYNYPLVSKDLIEKINFNPKDHLKLRNIITPEQEYFVQSLVPKLLENINKNLGFFDEVKIFEIGTCFYPKKDEVLPSEEQHLTIVLAISEKEKNESFYLTKGILELLLDHLKIKNVDFKEIKEQHPFLDENRSALICSGKNILGEIGEIKPEIQARFDIQKKVIIFDLELEKLIANASKENPYKPPTKFPAVKLDLAILVNKNIPYKDIEEGIRKAEKDILVKIELFDVYQGKQIAKSKKSLAFHLTFQSNKKTLKLEEAQTRLEKIINSLKKEFDIGLRK